MLRPAILILSLALCGAARAETVNGNMALGCGELSTHQSIRLFFRSGEGDAAESLMRSALKSGSCRQMPNDDRVAVRERSGAFVCVKGATTVGRCEWVEAKDLKP